MAQAGPTSSDQVRPRSSLCLIAWLALSSAWLAPSSVRLAPSSAWLAPSSAGLAPSSAGLIPSPAGLAPSPAWLAPFPAWLAPPLLGWLPWLALSSAWLALAATVSRYLKYHEGTHIHVTIDISWRISYTRRTDVVICMFQNRIWNFRYILAG